MRADRASSAEGKLAQLAAFRVGPEEYALDIMRIREIINPLKITKVPKAPPFIEGVIELRGAILPILDLRKRFDVTAEAGRANKYIIVSIEGKIIGLIVDAVNEVLRVPQTDIKPPPELGFGEGASPFFSGVCHIGDRIIMVLNIDEILTRKEKIELGNRDASAEPAGKDGSA